MAVMTAAPDAGHPQAAQTIDDAVAIARIAAPIGHEGARLAWLEQRLAGSPGQRRRDGIGNLIWQARASERSSLLLLVHVDTVFAVGAEPSIEIKDGRIIGPGAGDNAAAIAVTIQSFDQLLRARPSTSVAVVFTVGEESYGNLRGARFACEKMPTDAVVALEGHGLGVVYLQAVGSIRLRVRVEGPGGHSWWDHGAPSAIDGLRSLLDGIADMRARGIAVNVGSIAGGTAPTAIAEEASAEIDLRTTDPAVLREIAAVIDDLRVPAPLRLTTEILGERPAGELSADHELARMVLDAHVAAGVPATMGSGSTDANAALAAGIPALAFGCATGSGMHSARESIEAASLQSGARVLSRMLTMHEERET